MEDKRHAIDSRPSDAIALALRAGSPIYVADHVLEQSKIDPSGLAVEGGDEDENEDEWTKMLKNYNPGKGKDKVNRVGSTAADPDPRSIRKSSPNWPGKRYEKSGARRESGTLPPDSAPIIAIPSGRTPRPTRRLSRRASPSDWSIARSGIPHESGAWKGAVAAIGM